MGLIGIALGACAARGDASSQEADVSPSEPQPDVSTTPPPRPPLPRRPVVAPSVIELGEVPAFEEVVVDVPADALGFNVVVTSPLPTARVGVLRITSPSGEVVHDGYTPKGGSHATSLSIKSIAAGGVPTGEGDSLRPLVPGPWRIVFGDGRVPRAGGVLPELTLGEKVAPLRARVVVQRGATMSDVFAGARLDVVVHVPEGMHVGEVRLDARRAREDAAVEERLHVFFQGMKALFDVDRGDVRFEPAPATLSSLDYQRLDDAFAVAGDTPAEQALHVVLTEDVSVGLGANAWGVAPSVPGAAMLNGTALSAVVLVVGTTDPVLDGLVLLHEAGHFFGLGHTSELDGRNGDPLTDTPRCEGLAPEPASAQACPDRTNLMFPTYTSTWASALEVSASQRAVVQGSPLIRVFADRGRRPTSSPTGLRGATWSLAREGGRAAAARVGRACLSPGP